MNDRSKKENAIKILFLAANPRDTNSQRLKEEMRGIKKALRHVKFINKLVIRQQWAVRIADLQEYLLQYIYKFHLWTPCW